MLTALLNGVVVSPVEPALQVNDRGLLYGDGVFESMLLANGQVRFWDDHLQRLQQGCARLKITAPEAALLRSELVQLITQHRDAVIKLIVTRGGGERGYRPGVATTPTRLWQVFAPLANAQQAGITIRCCETRLARSTLLAGIKHLNRLEQVLAQAEWSDTNIAEGLLLDTEGELISGTMSNVFMRINDVLVTPDLRFCGVRGVMRQNVLRVARQFNLTSEERAVWPEELPTAQEVFMTNAVRGIQPVVSLQATQFNCQWPVGKVTLQLRSALHHA